MSLLLGHEIYEAKFTQALTILRQSAPGSEPYAQAFAVMRSLGLTDGDIFYWIGRGKRR